MALSLRRYNLFLLLEGIRNLVRTKLATVVITVMIALSLLICGLFYLTAMKLKESSDLLESAAEIEAFLEESLPPEQVESIGDALLKSPGVRSLHYISKDSAAALFSHEIGEDIYRILGENPLPASFRIAIDPAMLDRPSIDSLIAFVSRLAGVDEVIAQREFILDLFRYRTTIGILYGIIGAAFIGITTIIIMNTTKLSIISRKKSIEVMKLVGASNSFIKGPFLIEGIVQGLMGGFLGYAITTALVYLANYLLGLTLLVTTEMLLSMVLGGCCLGVSGSYTAVSRHIEGS